MKLHVDLDCYFVSAERLRHPELRGVPACVAGGGNSKFFDKRGAHQKRQGVLFEDTGAFNSPLEFKNNYTHNLQLDYEKNFLDKNGAIKGIAIAKSYEAKDKGVKTAMPLREALVLCPDLMIVPSDHLYYQELSKELKEYLHTKIPIIEQYSIDEFFGDVSGWIADDEMADFIKELQQGINQKMGLPCSIGACHSKWLSKLLTNLAKPYGTLFVSNNDELMRLTQDVNIKEFAGIGAATIKKLQNYGIDTLGELRDKRQVIENNGKAGGDLIAKITGEDSGIIKPRGKRKSIGLSRNFEAIKSRDELKRRVIIMSRYLAHSILKMNLNPTTFSISIRYEHSLKSSQSITQNRLFNERFMIDLMVELFSKVDIYLAYKVHYLGMSAGNFVDDQNIKTLSLMDYEKDKKMSKMDQNLMKIRNKYGIDIIKYAKE